MKRMMSGIKQGHNVTKFQLDMDEFNKILDLNGISMRFGLDDKGSFIYFNLDFINTSVENDKQFGYIKLNNSGEFERNKKYCIVIEDTVEINKWAEIEKRFNS